jgi:molecular chaperone GrpE
MAESERRAAAQRADNASPAAPSDADGGVDELLQLLQRERADFLNYKRRVERDRASEHELAQSDLLRSLLPFLDELDRAFAQIPADLETHPWVRGAALGRGRLQTALDDLAVEQFGAEGEPFDPSRHEALFFDTDSRVTDQRVASVVRPGYRVGNRVLRPAQVGVVGPAQHETSQHYEASVGDQESTPDGGDQERQAAAKQSRAAHSQTHTRAGG